MCWDLSMRLHEGKGRKGLTADGGDSLDGEEGQRGWSWPSQSPHPASPGAPPPTRLTVLCQAFLVQARWLSNHHQWEEN